MISHERLTDAQLFLWKLFVFFRYGDLCWPHLNEHCWRCHQENFDSHKAAVIRRFKQAVLDRTERA